MIQYNFLNPSKIITSENYAQQIDEMHQKLQCLQPSLINRKSPILFQNNEWPHFTQQMLQKLSRLGHKFLPHPPYSPHLMPTDYHFFKYINNFLQGKYLHNHQDAKDAFQEFIKSWSMGFYAIGINIYSLLAKMC